MKQRANRKRLAAYAGADVPLGFVRYNDKRVRLLHIGWRYWKRGM